jgi:glycosyltransferase involved in cell wall biosynthesis
MEEKLVSILIPVFNRVNLVGETIESAINQTYKNIEIVICDNFSTDGTWELLQKYSKRDARIRILRNKENVGPVRNWKRCIDEAKGEFGKILFSDDKIEPNYIYETTRVLESNPHSAFVFTPAIVFSEKNIHIKIHNFNFIKIETEEYIANVIIKGNYPNSPGCALFRTKDLVEKLVIDIENEFKIDFSIFGAGNDLLLFLLTSIDYSYVSFTNRTNSLFREHKSSFTGSKQLGFYYDYSKFFFIDKHSTLSNRNNLLAFLKLKFWLYTLKDKKYKILTKGILLNFYQVNLLYLIRRRFLN